MGDRSMASFDVRFIAMQPEKQFRFPAILLMEGIEDDKALECGDS